MLNALGFTVRPKAGYEIVPGGHSGTTGSDEIASNAVRRARPFDPNQKLASYRKAAESAARTPEETIALREKAVAKHRMILVGLNRVLSATGWIAIEEIPGAIDLWADPPKGKRVLFEAKTVTAANECHQVRAALAQLLEYRSLWGTPTDQPVRRYEQPDQGATRRAVARARNRLALDRRQTPKDDWKADSQSA